MEVLWTDSGKFTKNGINVLDHKALIKEWYPSIFLAGPSSRDAETKSWRPRALKLLEEKGFDGRVWVPEWHNKEEYSDPKWKKLAKKFDYLEQVNWEKAGLMSSTVILFWVPRDLEKMPAFVTNTEFGRYVSIRGDDCVYGRPDSAPKNEYLDWLYKDLTGQKPLNSLEKTIDAALAMF